MHKFVTTQFRYFLLCAGLTNAISLIYDQLVRSKWERQERGAVRSHGKSNHISAKSNVKIKLSSFIYTNLKTWRLDSFLCKVALNFNETSLSKRQRETDDYREKLFLECNYNAYWEVTLYSFLGFGCTYCKTIKIWAAINFTPQWQHRYSICYRTESECQHVRTEADCQQCWNRDRVSVCLNRERMSACPNTDRMSACLNTVSWISCEFWWFIKQEHFHSWTSDWN
jgi:hypothetical protein